MRALLLSALLSTIVIADDYVIVSGLAYHGTKINSIGREYDVLIEGIGYQHRHDCFAFECSYTGLIINDSNSHFMPIVSLGATYNVFWNIGIGAEFGVASKQFMNERRTIPIALPKAEIVFEYVIVNISYFHLPSTEVAYANFGLRF